MKIRIGNVWTHETPKNWVYKPDDRQERIEVIGGVVVQDWGNVRLGDTISCEARFTKADFVTVKQYWQSRSMCVITDESGEIYPRARIVIKSWRYENRFPKYVIANLEFWFC